MKLWQNIVMTLCWVLLILLVYTLGEISADPPQQTAHWIVDPETNQGEWRCEE